MKPDNRYTVTYEWSGHAEPRYVARFCGDAIAFCTTEFGALRRIIEHNRARF